MNDRTIPRRAMHGQRRAAQQGAVLFFTLIALVAMTLAVMAMVRSVDTSNLVAGNIALKQGAIQEADRIMNQAFTYLDSNGPLLPLDLGANQIPLNYFATLQPDTKKPFGVPDVLKDAAGGVPDGATQNASYFVIERLCNAAGPWSEAACVASPFGKAVAYTDRGEPALTPTQALYRISVKVTGPRNVTAYSQMVMNAGL